MIFSKYVEIDVVTGMNTDLSRSLQRLRDELTKLMNRHTEKITDVVTKATAQSALYEVILQGLSVSCGSKECRVNC